MNHFKHPDPVHRPDATHTSAVVVFDMMAAIGCDPAITVALIEDAVAHSCITASLFKALSASGLDIEVDLVYVRTCNCPLEQYDRNLNLPDVNYQNTLYLRAGGWLFAADPLLTLPGPSRAGFSAFPDEAAAIAREVGRRFNPAAATAWHHAIEPARAPYISDKAPALVAAAIKNPMAIHMANQMHRTTPDPVASVSPGPRF